MIKTAIIGLLCCILVRGFSIESLLLQESNELDLKIQNLKSRVDNLQSKGSTEYWPRQVFPPIRWQKEEGIYESSIHLNFKGNQALSVVRNHLNFPDDNGFVTSNVLEVLLAAHELGVDIDIKSVDLAIKGILTHKDKNSKDGLPIFAFWNQMELNQNVTNYQSSPANLNIPLTDLGNLGKLLLKAADALHIEGNVRDVVNQIASAGTLGKFIFSIPPDADDTACAIAVASKLSKISKSDPKLKSSVNTFFGTLPDKNAEILDAFVKYSYRPLSNNSDENVIDPRTYRWLRFFLNKKVQEGSTSIGLITTWFQKISDIPKEKSFQKMPFNINNVDATVAANGLYGISSVLISQPEKYAIRWSPELKMIFTDTVALIKFILDENFIESYGTSILLYYPSKFSFYYFVSRLIRLIGTSDLSSLPSDIQKVFTASYNTLLSSMRESGTTQILKMIKLEKQSSMDMAYWDDFLGQGDDVPKYEDRVFSTSTAVNTLFNIWTESLGKKLVWFPETPKDVRTAIILAGNFLSSDIADKYPQENAFFSASVKSFESLPFYYVTNYKKTTDGSKTLTCTDELQRAEELVVGVSGIIDEDDYQQMLGEKCFGEIPINTDVEYNCKACIFPYWSAPSYTHASRLLSLSFIKAIK